MSTERPGGWVDGIGWVALPHTLPHRTWFVEYIGGPEYMRGLGRWGSVQSSPVIVTRWADGEVPTEPDVLSRYDEIVMAERQRSACYCARTTKMCPDHQMFAWGVEVGLRAAGGES